MQFNDILYNVEGDYAHVTIDRPKVLNAFTPVTLQELKSALDIAEKDKNLRLRSQRLWLAIGNRDHEFHMQQRLLDALNALTLREVKVYALSLFDDNRPRYELLSSAKVSKSQNMPVYSQSL